MLVPAGLLMLAACGPKVTPVATPAPARSHTISAQDFVGHWRWQHQSEEEAVRRIEVEEWALERHGPDVSGRYRRRVTFLSTDGSPFSCAQALHYTLDAEYQVVGTLSGSHLDIRETDVAVAPSPCEPGERPLSRYKASRPFAGALELSWPGGRQTLAAIEQPHLPALDAQSSVVGRWRWTHQSERGDQIRVEVEEWDLRPAGAGHFTGEYDRAVTIYSISGDPLQCAGATHYTFRDRYTVHGSIRGQSVVLSESAATPATHPCVPRSERHLDTATGKLTADHLILTWRGQHRQVLRRDNSPSIFSADAARPADLRRAPQRSR